MNDIYRTAIHSIISVGILFILTRMLGKKQIAQLSFFDYVIGISIGSIAAQAAIDPNIHYAEGVTGLIVFAMFSIIVSFISIKSYKGRKILDGSPNILIKNGEIIESELRKNRLTVNDLLEECRQKNVFDIKNIEFAILETNGKLSVLLKSSNQPLTPKDMNIKVDAQGLCTNIIIDGKILEKHLKKKNVTINWLNTELSKRGLEHSDILLAYIDSSGKLIIHPRKK